MSTNANDIFDSLQQLLENKGYAVHRGEDDARPDLGQRAWWFTWADPRGVGDIETGPTCVLEMEAWSSAMEHYFANTSIQTYRLTT